MSKKSQALIDAEARIVELEDLVKLTEENRDKDIEKLQKTYETFLRQVEFLLSIIQDKTVVSQFLKDEAGRLIAESSKLRP